MVSLDLVVLEKSKFSPLQKSKFRRKFRVQNEEIFYCYRGKKVLTNQPAVALTTSNKEIVELILPFINNAWLCTDNL